MISAYARTQMSNKRDSSHKEGKLLCCKCIFHQIKANLAEIQPENHQNVQKTHFWQKAPGVNRLIGPFNNILLLWPSSLTKPDLLRFRCSSEHVLSETKSVTPLSPPPHFFTFLTSLTHYLSMVKFSEKINVRKFSRERP